MPKGLPRSLYNSDLAPAWGGVGLDRAWAEKVQLVSKHLPSPGGLETWWSGGSWAHEAGSREPWLRPRLQLSVIPLLWHWLINFFSEPQFSCLQNGGNNPCFIGLLCKDSGISIVYGPQGLACVTPHLSRSLTSLLLLTVFCKQLKQCLVDWNKSQKGIWVAHRIKEKWKFFKTRGQFPQKGLRTLFSGNGNSDTVGQLFSLFALLCSGFRFPGDSESPWFVLWALGQEMSWLISHHNGMQYGPVFSQSKINKCYQKWDWLWGMQEKKGGVGRGHNHKFLSLNVIPLSPIFSSDRAAHCILYPRHSSRTVKDNAPAW